MDLHAFFWRVFGQCRGISFKLFKNSGKAAVSDGQEDAATFTCTKAHQRSQSGFVDNSTERARHQETERLRDVVLRPRSNNTTGASQTVLVSLVETQLNNAACVCVSKLETTAARFFVCYKLFLFECSINIEFVEKNRSNDLQKT